MVLKVAIKFPGNLGTPSKESAAKHPFKKVPRTLAKNPRKNPTKSKLVTKGARKNYKEGLKIPASFDFNKEVRVVLQRLVQLSNGQFALPTPLDSQHKEDNLSSVTTEIPSAVLENLGIMTPTPNSSPKNGFTSPVKVVATNAVAHCEPDESEVGLGIIVLPDPLETFSPNKEVNCSPAKSFLSSIDLPHGSIGAESRTSTPRPTFHYEQLAHAQNFCTNQVMARLSFSPLPFDGPSESCNAQDLVISNCDYAFAIGERLLKMPPRVNFEDLEWGNPVIRRLAPYALQLSPESFFPYVAVRSKVNDKYHCIVVNQFEQSLVAYGGHFKVPANLLFDPNTKTPVDGDVVLASLDNLRVHLTLYGVPNKKLLGLPGYFLGTVDEDYGEELANSVDGVLAILDQVRLREHFDAEQRIRNHSRSNSDGRSSQMQASSIKRKRVV